jgi:hypothetical protein
VCSEVEKAVGAPVARPVRRLVHRVLVALSEARSRSCAPVLSMSREVQQTLECDVLEPIQRSAAQLGLRLWASASTDDH